MFESWMISAFFALGAVIGSAFVVRYQANEAMKHIVVIFERLEKHGDIIVKLDTKAQLSMTAKDVDEKYVSKELFRQFEKHIDARFDKLESGQGKILSFIERATRKDD
jgi:hypothetical protein